jgi:hypothetical protein
MLMPLYGPSYFHIRGARFRLEISLPAFIHLYFILHLAYRIGVSHSKSQNSLTQPLNGPLVQITLAYISFMTLRLVRRGHSWSTAHHVTGHSTP